MIFDIPKEHSTPITGKIMASEPFLNDRYFSRSVILLAEHNANGTMGFILNKPTEILINEALSDFPPVDIKIYFGGPVEPETLHFIHKMGDSIIPESVKISEGIYWGGDFEIVKSLLSTGLLTADSIRFYMGYSGWEPEQIKQEVDDNSWIITEAVSSWVFDNVTTGLWRKVILSKGDAYKQIANIPDDPSLN